MNDGSCALTTTASAGTSAANSVLGGLITAENGGALLGGLVGGVLGHQVGGGKGKTAATIVGTLGGALA
ncbi:glycine zipper 2TM domain-containing protein [Paludibacterium sp. dN 18-1]|uniref:Glycine zipper 2TM domain-containing protein n=1 Tax=Paludibacterium denitrificans TaxID=2675226 RepID=A0A844GF34_9NEIS|nr:glycine zipper 2TM domain-containing protein [Paludibacterium denitrificans]